MVRRGPDGTPQLVILDHGMYRKLDPSFRVAYCRLWQALILQDKELLQSSANDLGVGEYAEVRKRGTHPVSVCGRLRS